ncbi:NAD(P)-dependent oxidoreductase [Streptomyces sp. NPDC001889]
MAEGRKPPVTVLGLGLMGTALAGAFLGAGHPTTVWNRSPAKAAPLVALGAVHQPEAARAVAASPLVVACLTTYEATRETLEPAAGQLAGRTLVTLNSGTPPAARAMAAWAAGHGARFLDGSVMSVPDAVGRPDTLLHYSGDRAVFDEHAGALAALGGDTVHLGAEVDLASLYDSALAGALLPTLLGFFQGAVLITARGLPAGSLVPYSVKWLEKIGTILPALAAEIDSGDYAEPASSVGIFHDGIEAMAEDPAMGEEADIDFSWLAPIAALLRRAVAEGHREHSISVLTELLRTPPPSAPERAPSPAGP